MKKNNFKKGFTLIELLIVITIIGILAVALLPSVLGAPARARDAARKADINNIIAAIESYNSDHQGYPDGKICIGTAGVLDSYFQNNTPPKDPQGASAKPIGGCTSGQYLYCHLDGNPANYYLAAYMEINGDANGINTQVASPDCTTGPSGGDQPPVPTKPSATSDVGAYVKIL